MSAEKQAPTLGAHYTQPFPEYLSADAVSRSELKAQTPAHYAARNQEDTPALLMGRAVHCKVLEPDLFPAEFVQEPEGINKRTKAGKEALAEFQEANAAKTVLSQKDWDTCHGIADSVGEWFDKHANQQLLKGGAPEVSYFWEDPETGLTMKARADYEIKSKGVLVDLKTTRSRLTKEAIEYEVQKFRYDLQAAMYLDGATHAHEGLVFDAFAFVFVENSEPYGVQSFQPKRSWLEGAHAYYRDRLDRFAKARKQNDRWHGYSKDVITLEPPYASRIMFENLEVQ